MVRSSEPDRLDQCSMSFLPATRWICPRCPETVTTIATGEHWRAYPAAMTPEPARTPPEGG
jgi:hypothetical protein